MNTSIIRRLRMRRTSVHTLEYSIIIIIIIIIMYHSWPTPTEKGKVGEKKTPHEISYLLKEYEYTQGGHKTSPRPTDVHIDLYNFFPRVKEIEPRDTIIRTSFIFHPRDQSHASARTLLNRSLQGCGGTSPQVFFRP